MSYEWYFIFNEDEFLEDGLVSREYTYVLEDKGEKTVLVTRGETTNVLIDDVPMTVGFNDNNPYVAKEGGYAVYKDSRNDVWIGYEVEEEE